MKQFNEGLIFTQLSDLIEFFEKKNPEFFRVIVRIEEENSDFENTEKVLQLAKNIGDLVLVIDEVDKISREGAVSKTLWQIINYFRHDGITLLCCARRPARVARDLTGNADEIICFKIQEPNDLKYLKEFGFDENILKNLPKYEFVSTAG